MTCRCGSPNHSRIAERGGAPQGRNVQNTNKNLEDTQMRHFAKYDLVPLLSLLSVAAFPCVFLYARNCDEVPPGSMVPFLIVFTVTGLLMLGVFSVLFRNVSRGAFLADLSLLVVW